MKDDESTHYNNAMEVHQINADCNTDLESLTYHTQSTQEGIETDIKENSDFLKIEEYDNNENFKDSTNLGLDFSDNTISLIAQNFMDNLNPDLIKFSESNKDKVMEKLKDAM